MTEHTLPGPGEPRRNSNVEWLRVASMLMIVAYHYSIWGFFEEELAATGNKYFVDLFGMLGKAGTDLFVLISGYYMAEQRYSVKKFLNLMGTVWFYTIGAMLCLGYFEDGVPILGLPGCVMYHKATIFDIVLPRVLAGDPVTKAELAEIGYGGLCLGCKECRFPDCSFGKGW